MFLVRLPDAAIIVFFLGVEDGVDEEEEDGVRGAEEGVRGVRLPLERALPR